MDEKKVLKFSIVDSDAVRIPEYTENTSGRYVSFGVNNDFPVFINGLYTGSATLRAIIDGTVNFILGNGVSVNDSAAKWSEKVNRDGEDFSDLIEKLGTDLLKFNGMAVQVIYNQLGEVVELYALDFGRCRVSSDGKKVYYATRWGQYTSKYKEYDRFDRSRIDPSNPTQIFFYKGASRRAYPMPTWESAFRDCMAEIASSKYVLNNMANGLAAKTIITLPNTTGQLTEDEKKGVEKAIKEKFTGPDADSSFFLYFKEQEGEDLKVDTIQVQDESDKFDKIRTSARDNIFIAFRATPSLFGLPNKNNGFTQQEFAEAFALYQRTQVSVYQKKIERVLEKILGVKDPITILPFNLDDTQKEN